MRESWANFPDVRSAVEAVGYDALIDRLHEILREMWDSEEDWPPSIDVYAPLETLAKDVFVSGGIHFLTKADGSCYIDVPYSALRFSAQRSDPTP